MVLVARYSIFPVSVMRHSAARVVFCPCLHPCCPSVPPGSFASADDISKEPLQLYEGRREGRGGGSIWIKLDLGVALKVSRPFMSRWERACTRVCVKKGGGLAWTHQRGLYESSRISEAEKEARGASRFKYTFITSGFSRPLAELDTDLQHLQSLGSLQQKLENYYKRGIAKRTRDAI